MKVGDSLILGISLNLKYSIDTLIIIL